MGRYIPDPLLQNMSHPEFRSLGRIKKIFKACKKDMGKIAFHSGFSDLNPVSFFNQPARKVHKDNIVVPNFGISG